MPIRINLLAEAQAAEEMRRQDPLKKAIAGAVVIVVLVGAYVGFQQKDYFGKKSAYADLEKQYNAIKKDFEEVKSQRLKARESQNKVSDLKRMANERTLWAPVLNALQQAMTNVPPVVQLTGMRTEQYYEQRQGVKGIPAAGGRPAVPGSPPGTMEKRRLILEARDYGKDSDENYTKLMEALSNFPYFKSQNVIVKLESPLSPRQADLNNPGRSYVTFVIECQFADRERK